MNQAPAQTDSYCLWELGGVDFNLGIVGAGPGFLTILDIVASERYQEFLPPMRLTAVAEPGANTHKLEHATALGAVVYETCQEMLAAHPEINLLVELTGNTVKLRRLRAELPPSVGLVDHICAVFLCGMHNMLQAGQHCQLNLVQHQALLQAIIDEVREDILVLDKEQRVVDMNLNVSRRSGKSKEELRGMPCWQVQGMEEGALFCHGPDPRCPFASTLSTGQPTEAMLTRVNDDGQLLYFRVYAYPIHTPQGRLSHVMLMRRDITSRTRKEKIQQQREKLTVIGEMSTYLAHEIRNPLFAIGGFTNSLLRSPNLEQKEREKLTIIAEETKRLDNMLTSILNFVRPGRSALARTDCNAVAEETVELMQIGYGSRGVTIAFLPGDHLPLVNGEPEVIKQCLVNLIKNGVEAMTESGAITIRTGLNQDMVTLSVADTGRGMTEAEMEKVFSPFYSTKEQGYGLGLAMIKKMVEEMGGRVELKSREGVGTEVTLYLSPILPVDEDKELAVSI